MAQLCIERDRKRLRKTMHVQLPDVKSTFFGWSVIDRTPELHAGSTVRVTDYWH